MDNTVAVRRLLARSPIPSMLTAATASRLRVLAYHGVPDQDRFRAQMDHLRRAYEPISLEGLHDALHLGEPLPRRSVLVTFDDGDRSVIENGLPILASRGIPAVVYVVADLVDTTTPTWWYEVGQLFRRGRRPAGPTVATEVDLVRMLKAVPDLRRREIVASMRDGAPVVQQQLTSDDLRDLVARGVAVGNHTADHPCLDRCDDAEVERQITRAHERLCSILGTAPVTFAYPNGNPDLRARSMLEVLGYRSVFLFDHRTVRLPADPMALSRLRVDAADPVDEFELMTSGVHSAVHHRVPGRR